MSFKQIFMKFQKKYIFVITLCILSIFICSQLWSFIKFPINRYDIIGEYSLNNYSPLNDVIKYLIFIFIPLAVFLISKKIILSNNIRETETAKVIENIQRDVNIGLINEFYLVCKRLNLDFNNVINLASSKWNFIKYR